MQDVEKLSPVRHAPLRGLVRDQILESVVAGHLRPGTRLTEAELATQLGTSRVPVREALQELARDGWIDLLPRQGARVHVPQISDVEEVFAVRAALESESARIAARMVTSEIVGRLQAIVDKGRARAEARDEDGASVVNSEFHREIALVTGNQMLVKMLAMLEKRVRWYFSQVAAVRGVQSWIEHQRIVDYIAAGDAEAAALEARRHTEYTLNAYYEHAANAEPRSE